MNNFNNNNKSFSENLRKRKSVKHGRLSHLHGHLNTRNYHDTLFYNTRKKFSQHSTFNYVNVDSHKYRQNIENHKYVTNINVSNINYDGCVYPLLFFNEKYRNSNANANLHDVDGKIMKPLCRYIKFPIECNKVKQSCNENFNEENVVKIICSNLQNKAIVNRKANSETSQFESVIKVGVIEDRFDGFFDYLEDEYVENNPRCPDNEESYSSLDNVQLKTTDLAYSDRYLYCVLKENDSGHNDDTTEVSTLSSNSESYRMKSINKDSIPNDAYFKQINSHLDDMDITSFEYVSLQMEKCNNISNVVGEIEVHIDQNIDSSEYEFSINTTKNPLYQVINIGNSNVDNYVEEIDRYITTQEDMEETVPSTERIIKHKIYENNVNTRLIGGDPILYNMLENSGLSDSDLFDIVRMKLFDFGLNNDDTRVREVTNSISKKVFDENEKQTVDTQYSYDLELTNSKGTDANNENYQAWLRKEIEFLIESRMNEIKNENILKSKQSAGTIPVIDDTCSTTNEHLEIIQITNNENVSDIREIENIIRKKPIVTVSTETRALKFQKPPQKQLTRDRADLMEVVNQDAEIEQETAPEIYQEYKSELHNDSTKDLQVNNLVLHPDQHVQISLENSLDITGCPETDNIGCSMRSCFLAMKLTKKLIPHRSDNIQLSGITANNRQIKNNDNNLHSMIHFQSRTKPSYLCIGKSDVDKSPSTSKLVNTISTIQYTKTTNNTTKISTENYIDSVCNDNMYEINSLVVDCIPTKVKHQNCDEECNNENYCTEELLNSDVYLLKEESELLKGKPKAKKTPHFNKNPQEIDFDEEFDLNYKPSQRISSKTKKRSKKSDHSNKFTHCYNDSPIDDTVTYKIKSPKENGIDSANVDPYCKPSTSCNMIRKPQKDSHHKKHSKKKHLMPSETIGVNTFPDLTYPIQPIVSPENQKVHTACPIVHNPTCPHYYNQQTMNYQTASLKPIDTIPINRYPKDAVKHTLPSTSKNTVTNFVKDFNPFKQNKKKTFNIGEKSSRRQIVYEPEKYQQPPKKKIPAYPANIPIDQYRLCPKHQQQTSPTYPPTIPYNQNVPNPQLKCQRMANFPNNMLQQQCAINKYRVPCDVCPLNKLPQYQPVPQYEPVPQYQPVPQYEEQKPPIKIPEKKVTPKPIVPVIQEIKEEPPSSPIFQLYPPSEETDWKLHETRKEVFESEWTDFYSKENTEDRQSLNKLEDKFQTETDLQNVDPYCLPAKDDKSKKVVIPDTYVLYPGSMPIDDEVFEKRDNAVDPQFTDFYNRSEADDPRTVDWHKNVLQPDHILLDIDRYCLSPDKPPKDPSHKKKGTYTLYPGTMPLEDNIYEKRNKPMDPKDTDYYYQTEANDPRSDNWYRHVHQPEHDMRDMDPYCLVTEEQRKAKWEQSPTHSLYPGVMPEENGAYEIRRKPVDSEFIDYYYQEIENDPRCTGGFRNILQPGPNIKDIDRYCIPTPSTEEPNPIIISLYPGKEPSQDEYFERRPEVKESEQTDYYKQLIAAQPKPFDGNQDDRLSGNDFQNIDRYILNPFERDHVTRISEHLYGEEYPDDLDREFEPYYEAYDRINTASTNNSPQRHPINEPSKKPVEDIAVPRQVSTVSSPTDIDDVKKPEKPIMVGYKPSGSFEGINDNDVYVKKKNDPIMEGYNKGYNKNETDDDIYVAKGSSKIMHGYRLFDNDIPITDDSSVNKENEGEDDFEKLIPDDIESENNDILNDILDEKDVREDDKKSLDDLPLFPQKSSKNVKIETPDVDKSPEKKFSDKHYSIKEAKNGGHLGVPLSKEVSQMKSIKNNLSKEQSKEQSKVQSREQSKGSSKEQSKVQSKEQSKGQSKGQSKEQSKVQSKEQSKVQSKEQSKGQSKEQSKVLSKEITAPNKEYKPTKTSEKRVSEMRPGSEKHDTYNQVKQSGKGSPTTKQYDKIPEQRISEKRPKMPDSGVSDYNKSTEKRSMKPLERYNDQQKPTTDLKPLDNYTIFPKEKEKENYKPKKITSTKHPIEKIESVNEDIVYPDVHNLNRATKQKKQEILGDTQYKPVQDSKQIDKPSSHTRSKENFTKVNEGSYTRKHIKSTPHPVEKIESVHEDKVYPDVHNFNRATKQSNKEIFGADPNAKKISDNYRKARFADEEIQKAKSTVKPREKRSNDRDIDLDDKFSIKKSPKPQAEEYTSKKHFRKEKLSIDLSYSDDEDKNLCANSKSEKEPIFEKRKKVDMSETVDNYRIPEIDHHRPVGRFHDDIDYRKDFNRVDKFNVPPKTREGKTTKLLVDFKQFSHEKEAPETASNTVDEMTQTPIEPVKEVKSEHIDAMTSKSLSITAKVKQHGSDKHKSTRKAGSPVSSNDSDSIKEDSEEFEMSSYKQPDVKKHKKTKNKCKEKKKKRKCCKSSKKSSSKRVTIIENEEDVGTTDVEFSDEKPEELNLKSKIHIEYEILLPDSSEESEESVEIKEEESVVGESAIDLIFTTVYDCIIFEAIDTLLLYYRVRFKCHRKPSSHTCIPIHDIIRQMSSQSGDHCTYSDCNFCQRQVANEKMEKHSIRCSRKQNNGKLEPTETKLDTSANNYRPASVSGTVCFLCGCYFTKYSILIHEKACRDKWIKRNEQLPECQRKPVPEKPVLSENTIKERFESEQSRGNKNFKMTDAVNALLYEVSSKNHFDFDN